MSRSEAALLWDLIASIDAIEGFIDGVTLDTYRADRLLRAAVERHLITIGEVFARLDPDSGLQARLDAPADQVVGMRNILVHGYAHIDDAVIYRTASRELRRLRDSAAAELAALDPDAPFGPPKARRHPE